MSSLTLLRAALIVALLPCTGATPLRADEAFGEADLHEIAPSIAQGSCSSGCKTANWIVEPEVPVAETRELLAPGQVIYRVQGHGNWGCGAGRCTVAYVLYTADDLIALWAEAASDRMTPLQPDEVPSAELRATLPRVSLSGDGGIQTAPGTAGTAVTQLQEDTLPKLLAEIDRTYAKAQTMEGAARVQELMVVKALLDRVSLEYPASNEALGIALGDKVGAVDPLALDGEIAELGGVDPALQPVPPSPLHPATAAIERCLSGPDLPLAPDDPATKITMQVELNDEGEISGMPDLVAPAEADRDSRRLFQRGLMALDGCPDLASLPYPSVLDITITSTGVESLGVQPTGKPSVTLIADPAALPPPALPLSPVPIEGELVWLIANEEAEKALDLGRSDIAEIQARLMLQGYDPNGIDGVLGDGARAAISSWQVEWAIPPSGYLDGRQLEKLRADTQSAFLSWTADPDNAAKLEKASKAPEKAKNRRSAPPGWYRDSRGWYCRPTLFGGTQCRNRRP